MSIGKVWLVGAGPGDVGLFTLKGREVLAGADVVVYDALVGQGVLALIPDNARRIYAGKRAGEHSFPQEETNRLLMEEAQKGNRVVRLKGGDPFVFGRGGEELELLAEHQIPFEVVPGVTSAFAVPAYNGIPVTHRDYCSSVHVITGHRRDGQNGGIDYEALVRLGGTLVFLMGIAALPDICEGLLGAGMDADTPAAVLERGTTAAQRRISATLGALAAVCGQTVVRTPAIIIVGKVCGLADTFAWAGKRPLGGTRILVTRPRERSLRLASMLRERGAEVLELPAIRIQPAVDTAAVREAIGRLRGGGFDWIVFTSPGGVGIFLDRVCEVGDLRMLAGVKLAAIGQGTQRALGEHGLRADFVPTEYDGRTLGAELAGVCAPGSRLLIPRAAMGGPELIEELEGGDHLQITEVVTYDTLYVSSHMADERGAIEYGDVDYVVFTSSSTVRGFASAVPDIDYSRVKAVCIGRQTQAAAKALGMQTWVSDRATLESLVEKVEQVAAEASR